MGDLAVEVGCLDRVTVDEAEGADAGAGDVGRGRTPEAARPDDEDGRGLESELAWVWVLATMRG